MWNMINENTKITVIGLGVLGGSYAKGFANAGIHVNAVDIDENSIREAKKNGWIKEGGSDPAIAEGSDIIISCLYPHTFISWVKENQKYFKPGSILTDVTGVKRSVIHELNDILRSDVEYISCHPMAGRESRGLAFADEKRFESANFIIVPTEKNTPEAIALADEIAHILKFQKISILSAEEHDKMIGFLSQLTHVIAVSLMNVADNTHLVDYTGDSFRDLTRIAMINEDLWPELFVMNKDNLTAEIDSFIEEMRRFEDLLKEEDFSGMKEKMKLSTERRKMFIK